MTCPRRSRSRITVIGPAFPWRGGLPLLTTELAHRLAAAGHAVQLRTWTVQGPARLLPAQRHPLVIPEAAVYPVVREPLSWRNPLHWWGVGQRSASTSDVVVLIFYTTVQALALSIVARLARRRARVIVICANAVPHESRPGDRMLISWLLRSTHAALVHTEAEREALLRLTDNPVAVAALPPHLPDTARSTPGSDRPPLRRLLFFGKVRHYKGVDLLLEALVDVPDVHLRIVGEFYEDVAQLRAHIDRLGLAGRVQVAPGYLPAPLISELFSDVDALVLPYRTATASQLVALAHRHGLPTVATAVGNFPDTVRHGTDGLLCAPDDAVDLARTLLALYEPGRLEQLRAGVRAEDPDSDWQGYLRTLRLLTHPVGAPEPLQY